MTYGFEIDEAGMVTNPSSFQVRAPRLSDRSTSDEVRVPDPGSDPWRRARVAVVDAEVVGAAWLDWDATTESYYCEVVVDPEHRRRGVGTALYAGVCQTIAGDAYPVLARAMASRPERRAFADALGCSVRTHCPEPWVDPTSPELQRWTVEQKAPAGQVVVGLDDVHEAELTQAWTDYFTQAHAGFGTVRRDQVGPAWTALCRGLDPQASKVSVAEADRSITAISLVVPDGWDGRTRVIAEATRARADGEQLVGATLAGSFAALDHRGVRLVELEGHSSDAHYPALLEDLPRVGSDPMDVLELRRR